MSDAEGIFRLAGPLRPDYDAVDWASTPLGPPSDWPQTLRAALSQCLTSIVPCVLAWGDDLVLLYNAGFAGMIGDGHPAALGSPYERLFPDSGDDSRPSLRQVLRTGAGSYLADVPLPVRQQGSAWTRYFTYGRSPVMDESGAVLGVHTVVLDTTDRVLALRGLRAQTARLELLQRLTGHLAATLTARDIAAVVLSEAMPELGAVVANVARLAGATVERISGSPLPGFIDEIRHRPVDAPVPACQVIVTGEPVILQTHEERVAAYDDPWVEQFASCGPVAAFPMMVNGVAVGSLSFAFPAGRELAAEDVALVQTLADQCGQALERSRLIEAEIAERDRAQAISLRERAARQRLAALQEVTAGMATAVTTQEVTAVLARRAVGLVSDFGVVALRDDVARCWRLQPSGQLPGEVARRYASVPFAEADTLPATHAAASGRPVQLATRGEVAARYPRALWAYLEAGTRSVLAVPVLVAGRSVGALAFGFHAEGDPDADTASIAATLAELAGQALERAGMYERERDAAHQLQQALLPKIPAELSGVRAGAVYRPAEAGREVGGDWYDVFALPSGAVGFAVGDVVGHDLKAATVMAQLQASLRSSAVGGAAPADVLASLDVASAGIPGADGATVGYAEYDPASRWLRYACAGHPAPLLVVAGTASFLTSGRSQPVGYAAGPRVEAGVEVPPQAWLLWYSDGLVERRGRGLDEGLDRLRALAGTVCIEDPQAACEAIVEAMLDGDPVADDAVVACLAFDAPAAP